MEQPPLVGNIPVPWGAALPNRTHFRLNAKMAKRYRMVYLTNEAWPQTDEGSEGMQMIEKFTPRRSEAMPR
jgi:hypothetical protein